MKTLQHLFDKNLEWATTVKRENPDLFSELSKQQKPDYLWIGCSDSRVPASQIIGLAPGDLFVHRNIANVVLHTDDNCMSVIEYAVSVLEVKHIIICGHYGCGGIKAAMEMEKKNKQNSGAMDRWLYNIDSTCSRHEDELSALTSCDERFDLLCELNVIEQVENIRTTTILQDAWKNGTEIFVHGWIYNLEDGILKDLDISKSTA